MTFSLSPWTFFLVFGRTAALITFFPMLSDMPIPRTVKVGIVMWLTFAIMPLVPPTVFEPTTIPELALAVGLEAVVGILFAFTARLIFSGITLGVQWIDAEVGFQVAQQINPLSGVPTSPVGTLTMILASLLFWCLGYFENLIMVWARIFQLLPAPVSHIPKITGDALVMLSSQMFIRALEIATPIVVVMFMVTLAMALFARAIQGVSIFVESYNLKLLLGMGALITLAPLLLTLLQKHLEAIPDSWSVMVRAMQQP
jgi:flagellar biosynthesis protein FliR